MSKKKRKIYQTSYSEVGMYTWDALSQLGLIPDGCMPPPITVLWKPDPPTPEGEEPTYTWAMFRYKWSANLEDKIGMMTDYFVEIHHTDIMRYANEVFDGKLPIVARRVMIIQHFVHEYLHYVNAYRRYMCFNSDRPEYNLDFDTGFELWLDSVQYTSKPEIRDHRAFKIERENELKTLKAVNLMYGLNPELVVKYDGRMADRVIKKKAEDGTDENYVRIMLATLEFMWSNFQVQFTVTPDWQDWCKRRTQLIKFLKSQADNSMFQYFD